MRWQTSSQLFMKKVKIAMMILSYTFEGQQKPKQSNQIDKTGGKKFRDGLKLQPLQRFEASVV